MVKLGLKAALVALAITGASGAYAQSTGSDTGTASIKVIRPITVTKDRDLAFGTIVRPSSTGTDGQVSIAATNAGTRSVTNDVVALASPASSSAQFTIAGEGAQFVSVTIPATVTLERSGGSETLELTVAHNLATPGNTQLDGSLGGDGSTTVYVGGSIPITTTTATGDYSKTFTVSAAYN